MRITLIVLTFCGLLASGCQKTAAPQKGPSLPVSEVPKDIMQVAAKTLPEVRFESARLIKVGGQDAYEIRGKSAKGKIQEVEVSTDGKVLEIE